ncbi:hypothetical protein F5X99DRAFT_414871 [Biscogniauxia marginata]|nr:hypothetical protein F5X99DRAFT_414871 [Biscogniauxia marginata]
MLTRWLTPAIWAASAYVFASRLQFVLAQTDDTAWHKDVCATASNVVTPKAVLTEYMLGDVLNPHKDSSGVVAPRSYEEKQMQRRTSPSFSTLGRTRRGCCQSNSWVLPLYGLSRFQVILLRDSPAPWILPRIVPSRADQLDALAKEAPYAFPCGHVGIDSVSLQWSGFLETPKAYTGWFECSYSELTRWWYDGAYTPEICTDVFRDNDTDARGAASEILLLKWVIHDGAKRDRDPYMGDLAVAASTRYLAHDIHKATWNVVEDLARHQRGDSWIPPAGM